MSKIAENKAKEIAKNLESSQAYKFDNFSVVCGAIEGYDKAMQDFLEKAEKFFEVELFTRFNGSEYRVASNKCMNLQEFIEYFKNYMKNEM